MNVPGQSQDKVRDNMFSKYIFKKTIFVIILQKFFSSTGLCTIYEFQSNMCTLQEKLKVRIDHYCQECDRTKQYKENKK